MSYDFYIKRNMNAVEWKLITVNNQHKNLIKKLYRNWRHFMVRKFERYRV